MQNEQALEEFFRAFKISLNLAALYSKDHPYFLKSIDELKIKTDQALQTSPSIKISVTPTALLFNGNPFEKAGGTAEISTLLHLRKIKNLEIKRGVSLKDLSIFLSSICLKPKEIFRSGGINKIIEKEGLSNLAAEELDYSSLLKDVGEEVKDIWVFLLKEAVEKQDMHKVALLAETFPEIVKKFKASDLFEDEELHDNIGKFFEFLKKTQSEKFVQCQKAILGAVLREKKLSPDYSLDKVKDLFRDLSEEELANSLLEEVVTNEDFDSNNFNLFLKLTKENEHQKIASAFGQRFKNSSISKANIHKRVQDLFTVPENSYLSQVYRNSLSEILGGIKFSDQAVFDQAALRQNYRLILIGLLATESAQDKLEIISKRISEELKGVTESRDWEYLKSLASALSQQLQKSPQSTGALKPINLKLADFCDNLVWSEEDAPQEMEYFIDNLDSPSKDIQFYLEKIFSENKINAMGLKMFIKFFPQQMNIFYERLKEQNGNLKLISSIIEAAKSLKGGAALEILKHIYNISNKLMQVEALKAMQSFPVAEASFLLPVISGNDAFLKKEAFPILRKDPDSLNKALELLFSVKSPWGTKNNLLISNIELVEELGIREAKGFIAQLAQRKFFWNSSLRSRAQRLLERWHD
ncbi:MAG: hypothetical protein PHT31_03460 [Candidatus Omnitrophica bacterium]|nr:hypothetical protein [Candidatus Omnitrophota bacterium]MDD5653202.1 hypothetical protein [Candidatus Omnitrophota bacterium]